MSNIGIVPYQRIQELEYFYTSDSVKNERVIVVPDINEKKKGTEKVQGQWSLEQIEAAMDILRVKPFVVPKNKGGQEIPIFASRDEYLKAHLKSKHRSLDNFTSSQESREAYISVLKHKMEMAKGRRDTILSTKEQKQFEHGLNSDDEENKEQYIADDVGESESEADASEDFMNAYQVWNKERNSMNEDLIKHEDIKENCRVQANKQHDEDADANNRLQSALFSLKKFLQGIIKKFPFLEDIVRQKRKDGCDPYDDNDMRACYHNLLDRFRQSDEMGILTTIMSGMAEKQGSKSMSNFLLCVEDWHQDMIRLGVQSITMSDLAAIITLKGMNETHRIEFLQQENALALTLENLEFEDDFLTEDDDDQDLSVMSRKSKREKKSLLARVKKFIHQDKTKTLINQRLSSGNTMSNASATSGKSRKEAEDRLKEAQNVFIATLDSDICKAFAKNGSCRFGDKCKYKHENTMLNKTGAKKKEQECFSWRDHGTCKHGEACRFVHKPKDNSNQSQNKEGNNKESKSVSFSSNDKKNKDSKVSNSLFGIDDNDESWGNEDADNEYVKCIIADGGTDEGGSYTDTVMHVKTEVKNTQKSIGWDSLSSIHVAGDPSILENMHTLHKPRTAKGMGGTRPITHQGYSRTFGLNMHVIEGGQTPNIKSIGKALETDGDGTEYVAIFTTKGATQMAINSKVKRQIMDIVNEASENNRITGTGMKKGGVYFEDLSDSKSGVPQLDDAENMYAIASMYTHRAPLSSADEVIGMLASACVKEEHLLKGIREGSIKGLPECVDEGAVKKYFMMNGKDKDQIKAEIANAPLRTPLDYEPDVFIAPGEHLQIDNVDPSFSRAPKQKRKTDDKDDDIDHRKPTRSIGGYRDAIVAVDNSGYSTIIGRENKKDPHKVVVRFMNLWMGRWRSLRKVTADKEFVTLETNRLCKINDIHLRQA